MSNKKWTINDAKPGDIIAWPSSDSEYKYPWVGIFKSLNDDSTFDTYCFVPMGKQPRFEAPHYSLLSSELSTDKRVVSDDIGPANEEQKERLFTIMKMACYTWNAETRELHKWTNEEGGLMTAKHMIFEHNNKSIPCNGCSSSWQKPWSIKGINKADRSTFEYMCKFSYDVFENSIPAYNRDCPKIQKWIEEHQDEYELVEDGNYWEPAWYVLCRHYIRK